MQDTYLLTYKAEASQARRGLAPADQEVMGGL